MDRQEPITTSEVVISFLLKKAEKDGINDFTPLKIIKLVFLCHGWTLGVFGRPLIENRNGNIQAWKHGPVVIDAYHVLKQFKRSPVTLDAFYASLNKIPFFNIRKTADEKLNALEQEEQEVYELLGQVYNHFKDWSASYLVGLTHLDGTPWDQSYVRGERYNAITDKLIKSYYESPEKKDK